MVATVTMRRTLVMLFIISTTSSVAQESRRHQYSAIEYYRNYALSVCLANAYGVEAVAKDAAAAARGYLELGEYSLEAHTEATRLAKEFLARNYPSKSSEVLATMKCIDFYHSRELATVARKYRNAR
jgi:hypothetical protein